MPGEEWSFSGMPCISPQVVVSLARFHQAVLLWSSGGILNSGMDGMPNVQECMAARSEAALRHFN
jgi:hypothetical protein